MISTARERQKAESLKRSNSISWKYECRLLTQISLCEDLQGWRLFCVLKQSFLYIFY